MLYLFPYSIAIHSSVLKNHCANPLSNEDEDMRRICGPLCAYLLEGWISRDTCMLCSKR